MFADGWFDVTNVARSPDVTYDVVDDVDLTCVRVGSQADVVSFGGGWRLAEVVAGWLEAVRAIGRNMVEMLGFRISYHRLRTSCRLPLCRPRPRNGHGMNAGGRGGELPRYY